MKRFLHEPLVHFLLLGASLFGAYAMLNRSQPAAQNEITVSSGRIENLAATFAKVWQRPPTGEELQGLIDAYVKEEILSREAVALGLDREDAVIRRRLQQKMEFLAEDFASTVEPTEADLVDYLAKHPTQFAEDPCFTFRQVYLNPAQYGDQLQADAATLLASLKSRDAEADASELGDSLLMPYQFTDERQRSVASQFGQDFAATLTTLTPGEWNGPIRSGYGLQLVFVSERIEGRLPALDEIREQVKRELVNARRLQANEKFLAGLRQKYRVTIESPKPEPKPKTKTTAMKR